MVSNTGFSVFEENLYKDPKYFKFWLSVISTDRQDCDQGLFMTFLVQNIINFNNIYCIIISGSFSIGYNKYLIL